MATRQRQRPHTPFGAIALTLSASLLLLLCTLPRCTYAIDITVDAVTYGSVFKLVHVPTGHRLHSHEIPYGTGSGQQSVTAFHSSGDANSYWLVKPAHDSPSVGTSTTRGAVVKCGAVIRLQHLRTAKNLHSHEHKAPLNRENEVSAYRVGGDRGFVAGDVADNWRIDCVKGSDKEWQRGGEVRLQHMETKAYLSSSAQLKFSDPIPQQLQVSGSTRRNANTVWKTDEGFFLASHAHGKQ